MVFSNPRIGMEMAPIKSRGYSSGSRLDGRIRIIRGVDAAGES